MNTTTEIRNPEIVQEHPGSIDLRKNNSQQPKVMMYTSHEVAQKLYDLTQSFIKDLNIKPYPNSVYVNHTTEFIKNNIQKHHEIKPQDNLNQNI